MLMFEPVVPSADVVTHVDGESSRRVARLSCHVHGNTVTLTGELDAESASTFERALADVPLSGPIVVEMSGVTFIDSTALRALLRLALRLDEGDRAALSLVDPSDCVTRLLEITGLAETFQITRRGHLDQP
jgi:anti-anti-sigma factor